MSSPQTTSPSSSSSFSYPIWALVVGSILTTVFLVMVNKAVFSSGFPFVMALSTLHFATTYVVMLVSSKGMKLFEPKYLVPMQNLLVGGMGVSSIVFMNYSLRFNSVGVYQTSKLCVIPMVLAFQALKREYASRKVLASLVLVLGGVGLATVTDVELNGKGLLFAVAAVISTSQYQIWQGSKQREAGLSDMQMTMSIAGTQAVLGAILTAMLEGQDLVEFFTNDNYSEARPTYSTLFKVIASCLLAVSANAHSFALIGRTSAVTWQVVGHGKTCLIIIAGYILYPLPDLYSFLYNSTGISIAVLGVVLYSNLKMHEKDLQPDWCDLFLPGFFLSCLTSSSSSSSSSSSGGGAYAKISTTESSSGGKLSSMAAPKSADLGDDENDDAVDLERQRSSPTKVMKS